MVLIPLNLQILQKSWQLNKHYLTKGFLCLDLKVLTTINTIIKVKKKKRKEKKILPWITVNLNQPKSTKGFALLHKGKFLGKTQPSGLLWRFLSNSKLQPKSNFYLKEKKKNPAENPLNIHTGPTERINKWGQSNSQGFRVQFKLRRIDFCRRNFFSLS